MAAVGVWLCGVTSAGREDVGPTASLIPGLQPPAARLSVFALSLGSDAPVGELFVSRLSAVARTPALPQRRLFLPVPCPVPGTGLAQGGHSLNLRASERMKEWLQLGSQGGVLEPGPEIVTTTNTSRG